MTDSVNQPLRIVIFADSGLAQPLFETLLGLGAGWVAGLCTSRRKETGAGLRQLAGMAGIPVFEASRANINTELANWLHKIQPDVLLTFTFPYRLPAEILQIPQFGAFNLHGGKLPEYRGPQPVFWQIRNGETEGALTLHQMDEELDHGGIIAAQVIPIRAGDTYGLHTLQLAFAAVQVVEVLLRALLQYGANIPVIPQDESRAAFYGRPQAQDLVIRWNEQSGAQICALIKATNPWNQGAFTSVRGINCRLTDVTLIPDGGEPTKSPGVILTADADEGITVNCRDGSALKIDVVSMDEGILPGRTLAAFGIQAGEQFVTLAQP